VPPRNRFAADGSTEIQQSSMPPRGASGGQATACPPSIMKLVRLLCDSMINCTYSVEHLATLDVICKKLLHLRHPAATARTLPSNLTQSLDESLERLSNHSEMIHLRKLTRKLSWLPSGSGPFASPQFQRANASAVILGPTGCIAQTDAIIGLTLLAPYTRMPDTSSSHACAFLSLTPMEFSTLSGGWARLNVGAVRKVRPKEIFAARSTSAPLLMAWCHSPTELSATEKI
jgi:hypothetical protein